MTCPSCGAECIKTLDSPPVWFCKTCWISTCPAVECESTIRDFRIVQPKAETSKLEDELAQQLDLVGLKYEREYKFAPGRRYRADFAFPAQKLLVECEGGIWSGGRHTTGTGFRADTLKYNLAVSLGFRVLRYVKEDIEEGLALTQIEEALG